MNAFEIVRRLQEVVAKEAGLKSVRELLAHDHELRKAKFRDSAIYLARTKTDLSLEKLGELFGARHHTTLVGAVRREKARLQRHPPRPDKRTWPEWHDYLYKKAVADTLPLPKAALPVVPSEALVPLPKDVTPATSVLESGMFTSEDSNDA